MSWTAAWRGHWSLVDRRLLGVASSRVLAAPGDFLALLPPGLPNPFSNADLAAALPCAPALAGKATYALRGMGLLVLTGKQGKSNLYSRLSGIDPQTNVG